MFGCKHPFESLVVNKDATSESVDKHFNRVTYHLWCQKCRKPVEIKYAQMKCSADEFLTAP